RDPPADDLAVRTQAVERVRRDEISARAARDPVRTAAGDVDPVGASTRAEAVCPQAPEHQVRVLRSGDPGGARSCDEGEREAGHDEASSGSHRSGPLPSPSDAMNG